MYAGRIAVEVADEAIQLHGGYGYMLEYEVERFYRDAKIMEIYEGTREIQKNTIASSVLGKF
jgi:alkylation response protein AidB-like acyl-CoA dehydrogenase